MRRDSGLVLARIWVELNALVQSVDPSMVATIGAVVLEPGATNVIPGVARFTVDFRGQSEDTLRLVQNRLSELVQLQSKASGCTATVSMRHSLPPVLMDPRFVEMFGHACRRSGRSWTAMWSGAGHDAGVLATTIPAAMLFVPSRSGISHSPREDTDESDLVLGAQLLLEVAVEACSS
jgi:N-carbamoyl-L-amino-acid hydrolase